MVRSLKEIPPAVALPQPGGGRVEISVVDDVIWISDYSKDDQGNDVSNFTLCVARGPLEGAPAAAAGVHGLFKQRGDRTWNGSKPNGRGPTKAQRAVIDRVTPAMLEGPPSKAGYWFVDPTIAPHGGPVVVVDP
jgi:hypothetical protein